MDNTQLVFKMYDYFGKGDMESIKREIFHPDMTWIMPGHHPLSGRIEGVDAVIAFFGALFKAGIHVDNVHFGVLDDGTVMEKHIGHGKVGNEEYVFPTCTSYGIKDGKIFDVRVHTGDQHTVDRYMWGVFKLKDVPARLVSKLAGRDGVRMATVKAVITPEHVKEAYGALASGDLERIKQYWAEEMVWQVPGHNPLSGWYFGRDEFLAFMGNVGQLSGNSFHMENIAGQVIITGEYSADITRNQGNRANQTDKTMDIEVVHVLRWKDGKVIAGKAGIFGDGPTEYDQFWSNSPAVTPPTH